MSSKAKALFASIGIDTSLGIEAQVATEIPPVEGQANIPVTILDLAMSAMVGRGIIGGIHTAIGPTQSMKSIFGMMFMAWYLKDNPEAVGVVWTSEGGVDFAKLRQYGFTQESAARVAIIKFRNIEELNSLLIKFYVDLPKGAKVYGVVDSVGLAGSRKSIEDSMQYTGKILGEANSKAKDKRAKPVDFTRAKAINSMMRDLTPYIVFNDVPLYIVNHYYKAVDGTGELIMGGGEKMELASNTIWYISPSKIWEKVKNKAHFLGYRMNITVIKSRHIKRMSKFPLTVKFDESISPYSGMWELGRILGFINQPRAGFYKRVYLDEKTGEMAIPEDEKETTKRKSEMCPEFWKPLMSHRPFIEALQNSFAYESSQPLIDNDEYDRIAQEL